MNSTRTAFLSAIFIGGLLTLSFAGHTQTPQTPRGVIRLKVRYKSADVTKELARKRFFLIKGSLDENRSLVDAIKQTTPGSRECYYRSKGASQQLIKWLAENDCESVYCRAIEERELIGSDAVPEFKSAYDLALRELKTPEVARRWLSNYLPADIRDGYYNLKQRTIEGLLKQAVALSAKPVMSIMTDRKGTAYLTDIEPGTYTISNLVPSETGKSEILWLCEREVKAGDLSIAMRRPFILSNEKDPKVKCEVIERSLPVCN
ncbi:MAG TPA: hypothetical protein VHQ64_13030 [Pyrinomonadaceae bacterium]|nr:hypothetical protein [Pyrinomonadaceae bacterium]